MTAMGLVGNGALGWRRDRTERDRKRGKTVDGCEESGGERDRRRGGVECGARRAAPPGSLEVRGKTGKGRKRIQRGTWAIHPGTLGIESKTEQEHKEFRRSRMRGGGGAL